MRYTILDTPVGEILVAGDDQAIRLVSFQDGVERVAIDPSWEHGGQLVDRAARQLREYFGGRRREFDVPLAPEGTPFQLAAWRALAAIPFGETRSYAAQAQAIGRPTATRAIGAANGRNPIAILIPCHRVIGKDGSLTGFGGGLEVKRKLLALEREVCAVARRAS